MLVILRATLNLECLTSLRSHARFPVRIVYVSVDWYQS